MLLIPTIVRPSEIHGLGCFTTTRVAKGARVWVLNPLVDRCWMPEQWTRLPREFIEGAKEHVYLDKRIGQYVYCVDNAKYINHSLTPTLDSSSPYINTAIFDLEPSVELTCDYTTLECQSGRPARIAYRLGQAIRRRNPFRRGDRFNSD